VKLAPFSLNFVQKITLKMRIERAHIRLSNKKISLRNFISIFQKALIQCRSV